MKPELETGVEKSKTYGIEYFQKKGFRIFAMIDNEPAHLEAIGNYVNKQEVLLLHATTIYSTNKQDPVIKLLRGNTFIMSDLINGFTS